MKLVLGTVQFGLDYGVANVTGRMSTQDANAIVQHALLCGIDMLDTAVAYGDSESVLGQLGVDRWQIITKLPGVPDDCDNVAKWVQDQICQSIARLGVRQLYCVMLHRPSQLLDRMGPALYSILQELKAQGITRKIGISIYSPSELDTLTNTFAFDVVQAPLNILDRSLVVSGWANQLRQAGIEVHARSAFLQGLLLMPHDRRPAKFNRWADVWSVWDSWLAQEGLTPVQACLRFVNNEPDIDRVVVGVDNVSQLYQIVESVKGKLSSLPKFEALSDARLINPTSWSQL